MSQLLAACPQCESLLCAYGKARLQCEKTEKESGLVEGCNSEALERNGKSYQDIWQECLQLRQELFSHLLGHDAFETQPTHQAAEPVWS
jgi:hypothetical protein